MGFAMPSFSRIEHRRQRPVESLAMAKQREPLLVQRAFVFASDAELNALIAAFREERQRVEGQRLAMHLRRELGAGRVMITFRVVEK